MDDKPDAPQPRTAATIEPAKRDHAAARQLPELYAQLAAARLILARAGKETLDAYHVAFHLGGEGLMHTIGDKDAFNDLLKKDLRDKVATIEASIRGLGFDPA